MKNQKFRSVIFLLSLGFLLTQCKDSGEDLKPDEENELITTVQLSFTNKSTGAIKTFLFQDKDGDGGNAATRFDTITLAPNSEYGLAIAFLDESKNPTDDITAEIEEKADEHLIVVSANPAGLLAYTYNDADGNGFPIGLKGTAKTSATGSGSLKIQLRHQPGTKNGTATPGSDDVNLDFRLVVQ